MFGGFFEYNTLLFAAYISTHIQQQAKPVRIRPSIGTCYNWHGERSRSRDRRRASSLQRIDQGQSSKSSWQNNLFIKKKKHYVNNESKTTTTEVQGREKGIAIGYLWEAWHFTRITDVDKFTFLSDCNILTWWLAVNPVFAVAVVVLFPCKGINNQ